MIHRFLWFSLGLIIGTVTTWHGKSLFDRGKPEPVAGLLGRILGSGSAKIGVFLREFWQARRNAKAQFRHRAGVEL